MTILDIAKECSKQLQIPVPTSFVTATSNNQVLLKSMIYKTIQEIRDEYDWPELQREWLFYLQANVAGYPLPGDMDRFIMETLWNRAQNWPLIGPIDPILWQQYKSGFITTLPRQRFRVKGWQDNNFFIDPTPSDDMNGQLCVYEYVSRNCIRPKTWVAATAFAALSYCSYAGNIYQTVAGGTTGNVPPIFQNGYGPDGSVTWFALTTGVWAGSGYYGVGDYVVNGGNYYICTTGGMSASSGGPTGGGTGIIDGTVVWSGISVSSWNGEFSYALNAYIIVGSQVYICTTAGVSGKRQPGWTPTTTSDGSVTWIYLNGPYETFVADTDEVILNNDMIILGAVWRFLQAERLAYDDLKERAEQKVSDCKTKKEGTETLSVNRRMSYPWAIGPWSYKDGDFGVG